MLYLIYIVILLEADKSKHYCILDIYINLFCHCKTVVAGGEDKRAQIDPVQKLGVHCIVATPGRISDLLHSHKIHLDLCKYICLDEGDRMLDMGFDEEVREDHKSCWSVLRGVFAQVLTSS